ncbi:DUF4400 domain-containing protein [Ferrimonas kyonanensis]|uniref:DUF4400 domain-containing protein n=1 Tax=Ferrimonas kyonanensis TaxID=364763 RepID=UPI000400A625|nr:DUF4400 domain-containing protein [Ferrimonas kyonanensis]
MSDDKSNSQLTMWGAFILLFVLVLGFTLLGQPTSSVQQSLTTEQQQLAAHFSEKNAEQILSRSEAWYLKAVHDSGLRDWLLLKLVPNREIKRESLRSERGRMLLERVANNTQLAIYQLILRLNGFLQWWVTLIPFVVALLFHGSCLRQMSQWRYGGIRRKRAAIARKTMGLTTVIICLYFIMPSLQIDVSWLPAMSVILISALAALFVSLYQKNA